MMVDIADEQEMEQLGATLARLVKAPMLIRLQGDLGMGKTTFARGFLRQRGHSGNVKSPTYTLVEPYELESGAVYHFDLYRLCDPEELEYMGIRDYLEQDIVLIEWPERGGALLPDADLELQISAQDQHQDQEGRQVAIQGSAQLMGALQQEWVRG